MTDGLFGKRVAEPRIGQVAIQPAGIPGSTYVRPQEVETGDNAKALLESLRDLNPSLQRYGDVRARNGQDPDSEENQAFLDSIQGKSRDELAGMAKDGKFANRIQQRGLTSLLGSKAASDFRNATPQWYDEDFDQNSGNLPEELEQRRQETASALPDDASKAAFLRQTEEWSQRFIAGDIDRKVKVAQANRNEAVVDEFRMIADDGIAAKKSPQDIAAEVLSRSADNRAFRGLSGPEQNATIYQLAQEYAARGQPEIVKALLKNKRGGVGAVGKSAAYATKTLALIESAQAARDKASADGSFELLDSVNKKVAAGEFTSKDGEEVLKRAPWMKPAGVAAKVAESDNNRAQAAHRAAVEQQRRELRENATRAETEALTDASAKMDRLFGAADLKDVELPTATGGSRTYTAKQQEDDVVALRLRQFKAAEDKMVADGSTPEDARKANLRTKLNWFDSKSVQNPEWASLFNSAAVVSSIPRIAEGGAPVVRMREVAETYRDIAGLNPSYAASLVSDPKAREFLELYDDARSSLDGGGVADPDSALMEAARIVNRTAEEKGRFNITAKDAEEAVTGASGGGIFSGGGDFDLAPQNVDMAAKLYRQYRRQELPEAAALEKVKKTLRDQSVEVNGVRVFRQGTKFPKDFQEVAEGYLDEVAERLGVKDGGGGLFLADVGDKTGTFAILRKDGGRTSDVAFVRPAELDAYRKRMREEDIKRSAAWSRSIEKDGGFGAFLKWGLNGFEVDTSDMTPAEADETLMDDAERKRVDAFVARQARNDGVFKDPTDGLWYRSGGRGVRHRVEPHVTWAEGEKAVLWKSSSNK